MKRMKTPASRLCFCAFAVLALMASPAKAVLFVDPGFETPPPPPGGDTDYTTGMTIGGAGGWVVQGADVAVVSSTATATNITANANSGVAWLDLTGVGTNPADGVTQSVATTSGTSYTLTFFLGRGDDSGAGSPHQYQAPASLTLSIAGGAANSFTNSNVTANMINWAQETATFTAGSSSTSFTFLASGVAANVQLIGLDDVSIVANTGTVVPEPNTLVLGGIGALLFGWAKFRRRPKTAATA